MLDVFGGSSLVILIYMLLLWVLAQAFRDNGLADVGWGIGFTVVSWWTYAVYPGERLLLLAVLVSIWGLRLALHIGVRNLKKGSEDWRYKEWRASWGKWAVIRALLQVFLLQGLFYVVNCLAYPVCGSSRTGSKHSTLVCRYWNRFISLWL
jgi:steroid 5-alpha reductase family enzyme